jgi:hypothetical protein
MQQDKQEQESSKSSTPKRQGAAATAKSVKVKEQNHKKICNNISMSGK